MAKRMKRAWAKRFSSRTLMTANKAVLKEYADRPKSYGKEMPMSAISLDDLNRWAPVPIKKNITINEKGKEVVEYIDNCPPRIRALLAMRAHDSGLYDKFYIINIADGKYTKIDLFHSGKKYFFIKQVLGEYFRSRDYDSDMYAKTAYYNGQVAYSFVYKEEGA